ncbi:hypothetical protein [Priestia megaterium]|uniref:hypothetical protein n=1 Tax=Priestia megaterium TaxID=1404 RepID=UPI002877E7F1|nr:hypothetical protein [Priestia megaterium]
MNNQVNLTDDELATIQTSLATTLASYRKYIKLNGEDSLDLTTEETMKAMNELYKRFERDYF